MSCIISKSPMVAPKPRNRFVNGYYELARIYVPPTVAEYIMAHQQELRECRSYGVYEQLKEQGRHAPNYMESNRLQYLADLFWVLSTGTPVYLRRAGRKECVATDYLERENSAFGYDKVQQCVGISIRVKLTERQYWAVKQMEKRVEQMRSFKTDFYFHDMLRMSRDLNRRTILWVVGDSHTFMEVLDVEYEAGRYLADGNEQWRDDLLRKDVTWMGAALDCSISKDNDLYMIQGGIVAKMKREDFEQIHADYVEALRAKVRETMDELKIA